MATNSNQPQNGGTAENAVDVVNTKIPPFGIKDKLGYMFGDFGNDFFFILTSSYLMLYYTNVLGVSAAMVGTLFLVARCIDAFTDIGMGRIVDTSKPNPKGRYRVWIGRMRLPVVIAGVLMFLPWAQNLDEAAKIIFIYCTYILWGSFCYTAINIPYGSMAAAITANPVERGQLSTFRSVGAALAGLLVGAIVPQIIYVNGHLSGERFFITACVFAVCAFTCYSFCYSWCHERVIVKEKDKNAEKISAGKMVKELFSNRALLSIIVAAIVLLVSLLLSSSMNTYLYNDYFKSPAAMSVASMLTTACTLVLAPFTTKIIKKFGKKEACSYGLFFAAAVYTLIFFLHLSNPWIFCVLLFFGNMGSGLFNLMIWAMITDVIDSQEVISGEREDGTVYGIYSFSRKLGQALAGGLGGYALALIGYVTSSEGAAVEQTTQVVNSIYNVATLTPAIGYGIIACIMMWWYPLSKEKIAQNQRLLGLDTTIKDA
ncbi:MAG: MFS transporter [Eubacteriaceae bacterium]